jgi:hypothetical protein
MRQSKIKMQMRTIRHGMRVRRLLLCGTAPYYGTGARADARIRIRVSILKPGTSSFLKLKIVKHERIHLKVGADPNFSFKKIMFKIFLKLLGVTWIRIPILGSGSVKKTNQNHKMQMIPDPDVVRICESYQTECECIWIRIQEFLCWPQIRIESVPYGTDPLLLDLIGLELLMYVRVTRHLDHLWEPGNAMPCSRTMPSRSGKSQTYGTLCFTITILR